MKLVAAREEELSEGRDSHVRARTRDDESALTTASMLRVWLSYNARVPRYVRDAIEREIQRLCAGT